MSGKAVKVMCTEKQQCILCFSDDDVQSDAEAVARAIAEELSLLMNSKNVKRQDLACEVSRQPRGNRTTSSGPPRSSLATLPEGG